MPDIPQIIWAKTDHCALKLANFMFLGETFTPPAVWYLAQFTGDPGRAGSLDDEVDDPEYERLAVTVDPAILAEDAGAICISTYDLEYPGASIDWGTVTHVMLMDAKVNGIGWYKGVPAVAKTIGKDDFIRYPAGYLILGER